MAAKRNAKSKGKPKGKAPAKAKSKAKAAPKAKATKGKKDNTPTTSSASLVGAWEKSGQE